MKSFNKNSEDNPKDYWFKVKKTRTGTTWTPANLYGWLTTIIFTCLFLFNSLRFNNPSSRELYLEMFPQNILLALIFMVIIFKTKEKTQWNFQDWVHGDKKTNKNEDENNTYDK